ncbi:hypothetical protein HWN40_06620 [Methanolobus zinderi]|uniref:Uncharacterized protein n=1 Tax=Methanolobus zinderi TaxID=536044 RepID=A0A7D5I521_9EURY|nr:hypothetical protein [Methanolobus zinderi]QLC49941.1 hypothetical protein HWN40_06620 [Methanolobus zinderi]
MEKCSNFQNNIIVFSVILLILSNSGCLAELNSQEMNRNDPSSDIVIISSISDLRTVIESDSSGTFNQELINLLSIIENHDSTYEKEMASQTAYSISLEMENYGLQPLDVKLLEEYNNYESEMKRVNRVIDVLNENMDYDFEQIPLDKASHTKFIQLINKGERYLPVVDSYNELLESSDLVLEDRNNAEYVKKFYICAFLLSVDVLLIETGGIHKSVFKSVGSLNTELKLMKSVPYLGYSGYGLLLSTIYWSIRGYVEGFKNDIFEVIRDGSSEDILKQYSITLSQESLTNKVNDTETKLEKWF